MIPEENKLLVYRLWDDSVEIEFAATVFIQVNGPVKRLMINAVLVHLDIGKNDHALDLYCEIGNFTLPIACPTGYVLGLGYAKHQVEQGRENAARNELDNCEFR